MRVSDFRFECFGFSGSTFCAAGCGLVGLFDICRICIIIHMRTLGFGVAELGPWLPWWIWKFISFRAF